MTDAKTEKPFFVVVKIARAIENASVQISFVSGEHTYDNLEKARSRAIQLANERVGIMFAVMGSVTAILKPIEGETANDANDG